MQQTVSNITQNVKHRACLTAPSRRYRHWQHLNRDFFPKAPSTGPASLLSLAHGWQQSLSSNTTEFSFLFEVSFNTALKAVPKQSHPWNCSTMEQSQAGSRLGGISCLEQQKFKGEEDWWQNRIDWKSPWRSSAPTSPPAVTHVPRCHINVAFETPPGMGLKPCPGQPVPMLGHAFGEEIFLASNPNLSWCVLRLFPLVTYYPESLVLTWLQPGSCGEWGLPWAFCVYFSFLQIYKLHFCLQNKDRQGSSHPHMVQVRLRRELVLHPALHPLCSGLQHPPFCCKFHSIWLPPPSLPQIHFLGSHD